MKILCFGDSNTYGCDPRSYFCGRHPGQHRWSEQGNQTFVKNLYLALSQ